MRLLLLILFVPFVAFGKNDKSIDTTKVKIPIVFHIIHKTKTTDSIPNEIFIKLIKKINTNFNNVDLTAIDKDFQKDVANCNIFFDLAEKDLNGNDVNPIQWYKTTKEVFFQKDDGYIKSKGYYDSNKFLNIWICNLSDELGGYTTSILIPPSILPDQEDGVVLDIDWIQNSNNNDFILTHEIGHWLGLNHIWGVTKQNSKIHNCIDDDGVNDTPRQLGPHIKTNKKQFACLSARFTNYQNFMDYSVFYGGMFTNGQNNKMKKYIKKYRYNFIEKDKTIELEFSVLNINKQRDKLGAPFNFNYRLEYNTNIDLTLKAFFEKELGIFFTSENLEKLGLKIIATDEFKDITTDKLVSQDYIYKYLDINVAKSTIASFKNDNSVTETQIDTSRYYNFGIINPNYYKRNVILTNMINNKKYEIPIDRAGYNRGDKKTIWSKIPKGEYYFDIYTVFTKKLIGSYKLKLTKDNQSIKLNLDGYN